MKKTVTALIALLICASCVYAEHIKFTVNGPEKRYNQIKIVNNTKIANIECTAYFLEERDGKFIAQEAIGVFHLPEGGSDSCSCIKLIRRGTHIGIALPDSTEPLSYVVSYKNYPLFDIIEISLLDGENPIGKEF